MYRFMLLKYNNSGGDIFKFLFKNDTSKHIQDLADRYKYG